jgi:hypothetical protein
MGIMCHRLRRPKLEHIGNVEAIHTSLNPGQKVTGAILAKDRLGGDFSTWTPPRLCEPRPIYPLINMWIATSPSSEAEVLSGEIISSPGDDRLREESRCSIDRIDEAIEDWDVKEGVSSAACDNNISSSS